MCCLHIKENNSEVYSCVCVCVCVCVCACVCVCDHHPHCIMHSNPNQHLESIAHIVNGCNKYKGLHTARHIRIVDLISSTVKGVFPPNVSMYKHSRIMPDWFNSSDDVFCNIPNTP